MKTKKFFENSILVGLFLVFTSFSMGPTAKKFDPTGTWKYSAPAAPEGYSTGEFVIGKERKAYSVVFVLDEYYQVNASEVVYKKNRLDFVLYLEGYVVKISGTFEDEKFTGIASYAEGVIDVTAVRKKEEKE
jgi:hypothetical protein